MNFDRLRTAGAAAAAGAIMAVAGSGVQANQATYSNEPTIPTVQAIIDNTVAGLYKVTLETTVGFADYLGFGFNWNGPALDTNIGTGDFSMLAAYDKDGNAVTGTTTEVCSNASVCGPNPNNFLPDTYDYIYSFGGNGDDPYINKVEFQIAAMADWNPFTAVAARGQNLQDENDNTLLVADADGDLSDSFKFVLNCVDGCGVSQEPPGVPEISATGSVAAIGSVLALMAFLLERRGGVSMRRRSAA